MKNCELIIIDPQIDFCSPEGSLYIDEADNDMDRLTNMINTIINQPEDISFQLKDIHVSLDSHHPIDIAHPPFWHDKNGNWPKAFTIITEKEIKNKKWVPFNKMFTGLALEYVEKNSLCIWPLHCLIGSKGFSVYYNLFSKLVKWEMYAKAAVDYIPKGDYIFAEQFSAVKKNDNTFEQMLKRSDIVGIAGEAGSHCVIATVKDIYNSLKNKELIKKLFWLEDAISPVPGFENLQIEGIIEMTEKGMQVSNTIDFLTI